MTHCSLEYNKSKHGFFESIDCMKKLSANLKEHATEIINHEEIEGEMGGNWITYIKSFCYICKQKFYDVNDSNDSNGSNDIKDSDDSNNNSNDKEFDHKKSDEDGDELKKSHEDGDEINDSAMKNLIRQCSWRRWGIWWSWWL